MEIHQFVSRGTSSYPKPFALWDGLDLQGVRDWMEIYRPNTNWEITVIGGGQVTITKSGVSWGTLIPGYWFALESWDNDDDPPVYTNSNLHNAYEYVGGSKSKS